MKSVDASVRTAIRTAHDVKALPRLTADWNMNRYVATTVTNNPSEDTDGNDIEMFPIETIVASPRPTKGIAKARINAAINSNDYGNPTMPRFYVASVDDRYKYWESPYPSNGSGVITGVQPTVTYARTVTINKIVIKLENSWATPSSYNVEWSTNGTTWTTGQRATTPVIHPDGTIVLYWNGAGFSSTRPDSLSATIDIRAIRMNVTALGAGRDKSGAVTTYRENGVLVPTTGANSYFALIEMGAHLEVDLSDRVINVDDTFDAGAASAITPVGTITSNVSSVSLWNGDEVFSVDNEASPYAGYIDANVEMNLQYVYELAGSKYPVQQFLMYTDTWSPSDDGTVSVSLADASKYLKEVKPNPGLYEDMSLSEIVYRLCDSVGFSDYNIIDTAKTVDYKIPVFYTDGESTIWEIFDELATATQSLIYFDAWGKLNVKTREEAFDTTRAIDWTLRGQASGTELADIVQGTLSQTATYEANLIKVAFQTTKWSKWNNGLPALQPVWQPEGTVTLRASDLIQDMTASDTRFKINPKEAEVWPYKGYVQIQGEIIKYNGKVFSYRDGQGNSKNVVVKDADEYKKYNTIVAADRRHLNHFTGAFEIEQRGAWNSMARGHQVEANGYALTRFGGGSPGSTSSGFKHNRKDSTVTLSHNGQLPTTSHYLSATRGTQSDTGWRHVGTRFKFPKGSNPHQQGGLVFNMNGNDGYFVEVTPSKTLTTKDRATKHELRFYTRTGGNLNGPYGGAGGKGAKTLIVEGLWYDLDVYYNWGNHEVSVWINGKRALTATIPGGARTTNSGKFGMFIRGKSEMEFEYLYGIARTNEPQPLDDTSFLNRITGAYEGKQWDREWVWKEKTQPRRKKKNSTKEKGKWNQQFFDEFGPIVHEVREYEVKFDPAPVLHSRLYFTNDWSAIATEYRADAFSARFIVANAARINAVMNGSDSASARTGGKPLEQHLLVYGRPLIIEEQEEVTVRNEDQIRARGEIETQISSQWIQSKAAAEALGEWIKKHWSVGVDELSVQIFGNPLLEIGDLVAIDYPAKNMDTTSNQYFVTGISTSFESGISTTLTLRRKVS